MNWSVTLVMAAALGAAAPESAQEFDSYTTAYKAASQEHRPLLVILNPAGDHVGADSLEAIKNDEAGKDVLDDFVVAVIDTGTEHGKKVHELFGAPALPRTVVIDERQEKQVFRTSDSLQPATLTAVLEQYRHGVPQTVTAGRPISGAVISQPAYPGSLNSFQQGTCPNCRKF